MDQTLEWTIWMPGNFSMETKYLMEAPQKQKHAFLKRIFEDQQRRQHQITGKIISPKPPTTPTFSTGKHNSLEFSWPLPKLSVVTNNEKKTKKVATIGPRINTQATRKFQQK